MAELSSDVQKLLTGAEALFDALKRAKLTPALAVAIRDDVKFSKLQDPEIFAMCMFYKEIQKLAKTGADAATVPVEGAPGANGTPIKPDGIEPPASKAADKRVGKKATDTTP